MLGTLIGNLLSHYWIAGEPEQVRDAQARDWFNDLKEFHPDIVAEACGRWRRGEHRKPTIADIRKFCIEEQELRRPVEAMGLLRSERDRHSRAKDGAMQKEGRAPIEAWARELGYSSVDDMAEKRGVSWVDIYSEHCRGVIAHEIPAKGSMGDAGHEDARQYRESWARGLGYPGGFQQMMDIGLVAATKNPPSVTGIPAPRSRGQRADFSPSTEALRLARIQLGLEAAPAPASQTMEMPVEAPDDREPGSF